MTNILQVLLGLALVNHLMLDVLPTPPQPVLSSMHLRKTLGIGGATLLAFIPALLLSSLFENLLPAHLASNLLSTAVFCAALAGVLQCVTLLLMRQNFVSTASLPVLLPLIFGNCIVMGLTMDPTNIGPGHVVMAGLMRSIGFALILAAFTLFRERLAGAEMPRSLQGCPATLIAAALLSIIFMGFTGFA